MKRRHVSANLKSSQKQANTNVNLIRRYLQPWKNVAIVSVTVIYRFAVDEPSTDENTEPNVDKTIIEKYVVKCLQ